MEKSNVRYCRNGVSHLIGPLKKLFRKINVLAPLAKVYVQSLLPLPKVNSNVAKNVLSFNYILYNCCRFAKFYYMDIFRAFLNRQGTARDQHIFMESESDVHLNSHGLGRLATFYMYIIHDYGGFDPVRF